MDIFRNRDLFYLSSNCACKNLKELIELCYGNITENLDNATYVIDEQYRWKGKRRNVLQVHQNWILDSICNGKIEKIDKYILNDSSNLKN